MILINLRIGHIVEGYERICLIERTLESQWRNRLLTAYAQRRQNYERQSAQPKRVFLIGMAIALLLILGGAVLWFLTYDDLVAWLALGIAACGLMVAWSMLVYAAIIFTRPKIQPPQHPLRSPIVTPMLPRWREAMRGKYPASDPDDYGAGAEQKFVELISDIDASFVLYRLKQRENEDADVIVVGQKGIWVFEVKFWSGKITYRDGKWERDDRVFRNEEGKRETMERPVTQPPDDLWRRESGDIAVTLKRRASAVITRVPPLAQIYGGIVFVHPHATLDIDPSLPVEWNTAPVWKQKLAAAPAIPGMDERGSLEILDALLSWYQELTNMSALVSMDRVAREMSQQAKNDLEQWVSQSNARKS